MIALGFSTQGITVLSAASQGTAQSAGADNLETRASFQEGFAPLVTRTIAAVVNIVSSKGIERVLGSGVIVTPEGHILTNHHVVQGASEIRVFLWDNREVDARIVGSDAKTDIAVLKIDAPDLTVLTLGNSSSVHVGDLTLAIGAPFGLRQTVTMGIISATGRGGLGIQDYEDFIQTDASMNSGSSGGALINLRGELIGISTAGSGEYRGVGFAVPVDMVRSVMNQILKNGRVVRAWLGATVQPLNASIAKALGLTGERHGALVADVGIDTPASRGGLLPGDIVFQMDGKPVRDDRELNMLIGTTATGTAVRLRAYREGREKEFTIILGEEPARTERHAEYGEDPGFSARLGLSVQNVTAEILRKRGLAYQIRGVIVSDIDPGGPADDADISKGDIILEINHKAIMNVEDFRSAVRTGGTDSVTLLLIERSGTRMFVAVEAK
jgi:serine protease Do